ncbi:2-oxoglutarate-dependent dioxygenase 19-like [Cornus florida]|uniref:2-oxoglutarate-dependent dioxygenase 19-like n=1 Tax=Cornus florida TaxID=4283 RepID=UPI0028993975|nr:2-oxoglutarate-dependent dioxygenase 19-like [Cornus florida]
MASTASLVPQRSPKTPVHASKIPCIKSLVESGGLMSIPPNYAYTTDPNVGSEPEDSIPIIDFSLLTSSDPDQRSKIVQDLGKACEEWGFFMVINHGVGERLMKGMMDACNEFFNLTEEEKREFQGKHVLDPIRVGTSFNAMVDKVFFWRDYLKFFVHPHFHSLHKPLGFSEHSLEYSKRTRKVAIELVKGISESLGLEESYIHKALDLDSGLQIFVANLYPPCPQPEHAMGIPPHSDHGVLTLLTQNEIGGLQVQHNGKWVNVDPLPNSFLVNTADHLEILSNGKYKSVLHRAVVNNKATRISLAMAHGPSLDAVVGPAMELVNSETRPAAYIPMKYKDYMEMQQSNRLDAKSSLDRARVQIV